MIVLGLLVACSVCVCCLPCACDAVAVGVLVACSVCARGLSLLLVLRLSVVVIRVLGACPVFVTLTVT